MTFFSVLTEVAEERRRQDNLWGEQNHEPSIWSMILTEEVGELCEAMNRHYFGASTPKEFAKAIEDMREEAIQVAAVATAFIEALDRNKGWPT